MPVITKKIDLKLNKCGKCGHEWEQRRKRRPKVCPNCKRTDWNGQ